MRRRNALLWIGVAGWWTLSGLVLATQIQVMNQSTDSPLDWGHSLRIALSSSWLWVPLTMFLLAAVRRFPIEPGRILRALLVLSGAVALVLLVRAGVVWQFNDAVGWYRETPSFPRLLASSVWNNLFMCWLIVGVAHALLLAERVRQRERQAVELEARLAEARLEALSAQLNPHFLFNTLNSIAEQVHRDPDAADRMLVGLGALLRRSLGGSGPDVPLSEELELVSHYLDIERVRLGERLRVDWEIAPETLDARVPQLVLQPLVENAIRHGISPRLEPGRLVVRTRLDASRLLMEVQDDGAGIEAEPGNGIGLASTRARLECLYGADHRIDIQSRAGGGTLARLDVPLLPVEQPL